jgi:hypothetical protein
MDPNFPNNDQCEECGAIFRDLREALRAERLRFRDAWLSSGKNHQDFEKALRSGELLPELPDDQAQRTERKYPPKIAQAQRRKEKHESETGHSVYQAWRQAGFRDLSDFV